MRPDNLPKVALNTRRAKKASKDAAALHSQEARAAFAEMSAASLEQRSWCLEEFEKQLATREQEILEANALDVNAEAATFSAMSDRPAFKPGCLRVVVQQVRSMPDPLESMTLSRVLTDGLCMYRAARPRGVLLVISESHPESVVELLSLAVKTGNTVVLNGGSQATRTLKVLLDTLQKSLLAAGLPKEAAQLALGDEVVEELLAPGLVDLVIPRGSYELVKWVQQVSAAPVLGQTGRRLCNVFVGETADPELASSITRELELQMGLDGLLSYKYQVHGNGHTRTQFV